jgi:hypothetical protein
LTVNGIAYRWTIAAAASLRPGPAEIDVAVHGEPYAGPHVPLVDDLVPAQADHLGKGEPVIQPALVLERPVTGRQAA